MLSHESVSSLQLSVVQLTPSEQFIAVPVAHTAGSLESLHVSCPSQYNPLSQSSINVVEFTTHAATLHV